MSSSVDVCCRPRHATKRKRGRPTKVPAAEDRLIQKHVKLLSEDGIHVSREIVITYGKVILDKRCPELSQGIELGQSWAKSLLKCMKFVHHTQTFNT